MARQAPELDLAGLAGGGARIGAAAVWTAWRPYRSGGREACQAPVGTLPRCPDSKNMAMLDPQARGLIDLMLERGVPPTHTLRCLPRRLRASRRPQYTSRSGRMSRRIVVAISSIDLCVDDSQLIPSRRIIVSAARTSWRQLSSEA
jgi:hypothetical protein